MTYTPTKTPTPTHTPTPTNTPPPPAVDTPTPTSTPRSSARLDPRPPNIRRDGTWHEFTMRSNVPVKVVGNKSDRTLRLSSTGRGGCPASSQNASVLRTDGQTVKLMGCKVGDARVRLFSQSDDTRLRTYNFRVLAPPPTPTPTPNTCTITDIEELNFETGPAAYDEVGTWGGCVVKKYSFTLPTLVSYLHGFFLRHHVTVGLEAGSGAEIRLLDGDEVLGKTTSSQEEIPPSTFLGLSLAHGTYGIEIRQRRFDSGGSFQLALAVTEALPHLLGKHLDQSVVGYSIHPDIPPTGQGGVIRIAVRRAAKAWNDALGDSWVYLTFELGSLFEIKTVPYLTCGDPGPACATVSFDEDNHIYDGEVKIESPTKSRGDKVNLMWDLSRGRHLNNFTVELPGGIIQDMEVLLPAPPNDARVRPHPGAGRPLFSHLCQPLYWILDAQPMD